MLNWQNISVVMSESQYAHWGRFFSNVAHQFANRVGFHEEISSVKSKKSKKIVRPRTRIKKIGSDFCLNSDPM